MMPLRAGSDWVMVWRVLRLSGVRCFVTRYSNSLALVTPSQYQAEGRIRLTSATKRLAVATSRAVSVRGSLKAVRLPAVQLSG